MFWSEVSHSPCVFARSVERRSTSRPKSTMIAGSAAPADSRNGISRQFRSGIHLSALPPWCTSGQYWPLCNGPVSRAPVLHHVGLGFELFGFVYPKHPVARLITAGNCSSEIWAIQSVIGYWQRLLPHSKSKSFVLCDVNPFLPTNQLVSVCSFHPPYYLVAVESASLVGSSRI